MPSNTPSEVSPLIGSWRLLSAVSTFIDTKEQAEPWGPNPDGRMIFEPGGRVMFIFARRGRVPPNTDAERVAMFNDLMVYTGIARLDAPRKLVIAVDLAKSPAWSGEVVRFFTISSADLLTITTPEMAAELKYPGRRFTAEMVFEREHIEDRGRAECSGTQANR